MENQISTAKVTTPTRFEYLVGNVELFRALLDGYLGDYAVDFDILLPEHRTEGLFKHRPGTCDFCSLVRSVERGRLLCDKFDQDISAGKIERTAAGLVTCHAGLRLLTLPIEVNSDLIATITWGPFRVTDSQDTTNSEGTLPIIAKALDTDLEDLEHELDQVSTVSYKDLEIVRERLGQVVAFVSDLGVKSHEREESVKDLSLRKRETEAIHNITEGITDIVSDIDKFWDRLNIALARICSTVGASSGMILSQETTGSRVYKVVSTANLPAALRHRSYQSTDPLIEHMAKNREAKVVPFEPTQTGSICAEILESQPAVVPDNVALLYLRLSQDEHAVMALFVNSVVDTKDSLKIVDELSIIEQVIPRITAAYQNCKFVEDKDVWFEIAGHELLAPLHAMEITADDLLARFTGLSNDELRSELLRIYGSATSAARLARNIDFIVRKGSFSANLLTSWWSNLKRFLIHKAMDIQARAADKGIWVHVGDSIDDRWDIRIDETRFGQVIGNLLENAVKYSKKGADLMVEGRESGPWLEIAITSYGIPISEAEAPKVFRRGYRTETARQTVVEGSGLGLYVTREIMRLIGGKVEIRPSVYDPAQKAHKVVVKVMLPAQAFRRRFI